MINQLIESLQYNDKITNEVCTICKLALREGQIILQCPQCGSLFHADHLLEWLENKPICPLCNYKILEKKSEGVVKELDTPRIVQMAESHAGAFHGMPEQEQERSRTAPQFVFFNPNKLNRAQHIALSVFIFAFGAAIVFVVSFFTLRDMVFDDSSFNTDQIIFMFMIWPFVVAGGDLMVFSLFLVNDLNSKWVKLILLPSKIILRQEKIEETNVEYKTLLEIPADQINEISMKEYPDEDSSKYKLQLSLKDAKGKKYSLGYIMESERIVDILNMKRALFVFVKQNYTSEINANVKIDRKVLFKKGLKISLIVSIFHFVLWITSILLANYVF